MKYNLLRISLLSVLAFFFGGVAMAQSYTDEALSVKWSMANGESSTAVVSPADAIKSTAWSVASDLAIDATPTATYFDNESTRFTRVGGNKLNNDRSLLNNSYIEFKVTPVAGMTVTPKTLSFDIVKVGTGDPQIWVECIQGETTTSIASAVAIRKNSETTPSEHHSYDLTTLPTIVASGEATIIRIFIGKLANNKQVALANVTLEGTVSGTVVKYTTVYDIPAKLEANIEGKTGTVAYYSTEEGSKAPDLEVDALSGKLGKNNDSWAQINAGTILTLPGVPEGAKVTFALYDTTGLTINGVKYTNGQTYTATEDVNLKMTCTTSGYIKSITVVGTAFTTVLEKEGYTNIWYFGKSNGAEEFALQKSAEYEYTVNSRSLIINTAAGKLNNASRTDQWAQCNNGTVFKVPVYAGSKLSWGRFATGSDAGFTIDGTLYNEYYIATEEGTVSMTAAGISYLSYIKIEPATLYDVTGTISGASVDGSSIIFNAAGNGQTYPAVIASSAFSVKVPADTYTFDMSEDAAYVVSSPTSYEVTASGDMGTVTLVAASPQTVTGQITNAPAENFTLTFTGANSHEKQVVCEANATAFEVSLDPDTYTISSSVGTLSTLSKVSFKVLKAAVSHNIYFPEDAVPAATQQEITVDNTATVAANVYNTINDALAAAKAGNISKPIIILTSGQTYQEQVIVSMPYVTFKTSGEEKATITWYYGIGYTYYSLNADGYYDKDRAMTRNSILMKDPSRWGTAVLVKSNGHHFRAENVIFENSFNQRYTDAEIVDGVTPNGCQSITYNRTLTSEETGYQAADSKAVTERAAAIGFENDPSGCELYNCVFVGSQDTFYSSGKLYVKNCDIQGNTDYIFGGGQAIFDNCNLVIGGYSDKQTSAYITAMKGATTDQYIFRNCTVKATGRKYVLANLGRDWGGADAHVVYFNLKNEIGDKLNYSWTDMGGGVKAGTADLHIYDFDATINANYATTGTTGANINGLLTEEKALSLYAGVVSRLGFTPDSIYSDDLVLGETNAYNVCDIAASDKVNRNVQLTRTLTADQWNTIVLPFALTEEQIKATFGDNAKVAELTSGTASKLEFNTVTAMEANKPYIIKTDADFSSADIEDVTIAKATASQTVDGWTFTGLYTAGTVAANDYFMKDNSIVKAADDTNAINALSAYLSNANGAETVTFEVNNPSTGINAVQRSESSALSVIYNLAGQRVQNATKGIYVVNGKKVVIK